ncbi:methionyl-tRNA formyltransferase [bacterium]|nr:methionyl-tRNA formyltransferase [bacterium]
MRIVFMGTPDFAVPSLKKLVESTHDVVGVVTQPDRPKGRGLHLAASPIKREAQQLGLRVIQPADLKDVQLHKDLKAWKADCFVVVGFRVLPPEIYEIPPKGTINLHASLLPKYRGAAPIQWALIRGEQMTGVSTFFIVRQVDTGDLILQEGVVIEKEETAGELHDHLAKVGANLLLRTVDLIESGRVKRIPQVGERTLAPKILPEHCEIDWHQSARNIVNLVRGLSPVPGAYTFWKGKRMKIYRASILEESTAEKVQPGRVINVSEDGITVQTGDGAVFIRELQVEGKRRMVISDFLRGQRLLEDMVLG